MWRVIIFQSVLLLAFLGCQPKMPGTEARMATSVTVAPASPTSRTETTGSPSRAAATATPAVPSDTIPHFESGQVVTITYIRMVDGRIGWALGRDDAARADHILRTSDGGHTWLDLTPPELNPPPGERFRHARAFFLDRDCAWVLYEPRGGVAAGSEPAVVWATQMGWRNWESSMPLDVMGNPTFEVEFMHFPYSDQGWIAIGLGPSMGHAWIALNRMSDSWPRWQLVIAPQSENAADLQYCCKSDMVFADERTGVVTFGRGWAGDLFINWTHDGGMRWQREVLPDPEVGQVPLGFDGVSCMSHSPTFFSSHSLLVAVECYAEPEKPDQIVSFLYATQDSGGTWEIRPYPGGELQFLSPSVGWALGRSIYFTRSAGENWEPMAEVDWDGQFSFVSESLGWAVAGSGDQISLMHTTDGGRTWTALDPRIAAPLGGGPMTGWINFAVLLVITLLTVATYVKSAGPAALEQRIGPAAFRVCTRYRIASGILMGIAGVNYVIYFCYPLPLPLPLTFPWRWWISGLVALAIALPSGWLWLRGMRDAGRETILVRREHSLFGGIYRKIRHPQMLGELPFWWVLAFVLHSPFLALYSLVWIPGFLLMTLAEERDLPLRYGKAYEDYRRRTGAFFPKGK